MLELSYIYKKKEYPVGKGYDIEDLKLQASMVAEALKEIHNVKKIKFWICENDNIIEEFCI